MLLLRWMRVRFAALSMIAGCACAPAPVMLPLPVADGDRAVIVLAEQGLPRLGFELHSVVAIDLASGAGGAALDRAELPKDGSLEVELTALSFDRPLDQLGLESGAVALAAPGDPGRPIPRARTMHQTLLSSDQPPAWTTLDVLPDALQAIRVR
jgi:hypothetical protein